MKKKHNKLIEGISENKKSMEFYVDLNVSNMLKLWCKKTIPFSSSLGVKHETHYKDPFDEVVIEDKNKPVFTWKFDLSHISDNLKEAAQNAMINNNNPSLSA